MQTTIKVHLVGLTLVFMTSCTTRIPQNTANPESTASSKNSQNVNQAYTCIDPQQYSGRVIGDGHCVSLIKHCSGAPDTSEWRPGQRVLKQASDLVTPGTIIATFKNNRYPSRSGYHAAIYIKHSQYGIWVWDQWLGKPVHQRLIRTRPDGATSSNSAQDYRVVETTKQ